MEVRARRFPQDDDSCGFWRLAGEPPPSVPLRGDAAADAVVVGAGFTGLAAARRLAEARPDWRVVVLEAQRAGFAASGRNSGFAGDIAHRDPSAPMEEALRHKRLCRFGIESLRALVERHGIACGWNTCGRIHAAVEAHGLESYEHLLRILAETGEPHTAMTCEQIAQAIGTRHYERGVHIHATVLLQPAALVRALAASLPGGVALHEGSPVRDLCREGGRWHVRTAEGSVASERVFLAVNGFAPALGVLERRIFPLFTFASMTHELTAEERRAVGAWPEWGVVSEDRMGTTLRRLPGHRLLVRSTVRYAPSLRLPAGYLAGVRESHLGSLRVRWPALEGVGLEYTWGGVLGMTMNQGQFFGRVDDGLYAWAGCNGTGVAMGTASGMLLVDYALGEDSDLVRDALAVRRAARLPPEPFLGLGIGVTTAWLSRRAGRER